MLFRSKEADETGKHPLQYGLIAEEVAKVAPDLVQFDKTGKPFTVRYHLLTPMLLSELQKAHRRANAQIKEMAKMKSQLAKQSAELAQLKQVQAKQIADLARQVAELKTTRQEGKPSLTRLH